MARARSDGAEIRLTIVQYAGDLRETVRRFESGAEETYQAQRFSVDYVLRLGQRLGATTTVTALTDESYQETLPGGAVAIGCGLADAGDGSALIDTVAATRPNHLILRTPLPALIDWAAKERVRTMALLADSFQEGGPRGWWRRRRLAARLNRAPIDLVANHGRNASRQLAAMGVRPERIVPWDWPPARSPHDMMPKGRRAGPATLFFAGALSASKGVDDLVAAVAKLRAQGLAVRAELAGKGENDRIAALAARLGVADHVHFLGLVPNREVGERMRAADLVVVPSRHDYPEGLPLTIYEALAARTPLVASDHPMFAGALQDGEAAAIFPAGDADAMAAAIARLLDDSETYAAMSGRTSAVWDRLQLPVKWNQLIDRWLRDGDEDRAWLRAHSLASGRY